MNRTLLLLIVAAIGIGVVFLGYQYYIGQQQGGHDIGIGGGGVSIETN